MTRRLLWGSATVALYLAVAFAYARTGTPVTRPLYDGLAPAAPYRYTDPPGDLAEANEQPEPGEGIVDIVGKGSAATSISTGDGQMQVVLPKGAFPSMKGEKRIDVRVVPEAPQAPLEIGDGMVIEGNAYRVTAEYSKSGLGAELDRPMTAVLRYPSFATVMVRREGSGWRRLSTEVSLASLQLFADSDELGAFAAAGKPHRPGWRRWIPFAAGGLGLITGLVGYLSGRRGWLRKRRGNVKKGKRRR